MAPAQRGDIMPDNFGIDALTRLRETLSGIGRRHMATMRFYASSDGKGFRHNRNKGQDKASSASTVTCISSLVRAGRWDPALSKGEKRPWGVTDEVAQSLISKIEAAQTEQQSQDVNGTGARVSAGLRPLNPFTLSFLAEGLLDFVGLGQGSPTGYLDTIEKIVRPFLVDAIKLSAEENVPGSVRIDPYPPSAYLTQLAYRVLRELHRHKIVLEFEEITKLVRNWARAEVNRQMVLITMGSRVADPMQLAYAVVIVSGTSSPEKSTPEEKALSAAAIELFFSKQNADGSWPPSQPLFHYPEVGNAQCYEYELLTQMLVCEPLKETLLNYFPKFKLAVDRLGETAFQLDGKVRVDSPVAWASGHHPQIEGPESWSTACVYDFAHTLERLVAEAIRRALFAEVLVEYSEPTRPGEVTPSEFGDSFLDADLVVDGRRQSLAETLIQSFILPIKGGRDAVANGGKLDGSIPLSAILFGPPGTSKTELAKLIAKCVGWPLLSVDPSYLVQDGLDHLYSRANKLFSMLAVTEQVVAFLDEFDEMGRERTDNADISSRFITTAMLPKLAALNKSRQIIVILATNYIGNFDAAFSRGGRFDTIIQVMTPRYEEKLKKEEWGKLKTVVDEAPSLNQAEARAAIADLTFLETVQLVARLGHEDSDGLQEVLKAAEGGTLARKYGPGETWKTVSAKQQEHIRLPPHSKPLARPAATGAGAALAPAEPPKCGGDDVQGDGNGGHGV